MNRLEEPGRGSSADFKITVYNVRFAVKFPCRMSLHYGGKPITSEVDPVDNTFTFNQDISIKVDPDEDLEINVYLATEKTGSILAGLISAPASSLMQRGGERFTLPLQKCMDSAAIAEIKINHAWSKPVEKHGNMVRSTMGGMQFRGNQSPQHRSKNTGVHGDGAF